MQNLTALLIVRNEQTMLPGCFDSLVGIAAHLVIVDTGSVDDTLALIDEEAQRGRFTTLKFERIGFHDFAAARNAGLNRVDTPWTLWIDADERLSSVLAAELDARDENGSLAEADAWRIPLRNYVLGRRMRCRELARQRHCRLFRTHRARFRGAVHEGLVLPENSVVGDLEGPIDHHTMRNWLPYWRKVVCYTKIEAAGGSRGRALLHLLIAFPLTFWRQYLRRGCWRDGRQGWVWAATSGAGSVLRDLRRLVRRS